MRLLVTGHQGRRDIECNVEAAKAIGLTIHESFLARGDEVIE